MRLKALINMHNMVDCREDFPSPIGAELEQKLLAKQKTKSVRRMFAQATRKHALHNPMAWLMMISMLSTVECATTGHVSSAQPPGMHMSPIAVTAFCGVIIATTFALMSLWRERAEQQEEQVSSVAVGVGVASQVLVELATQTGVWTCVIILAMAGIMKVLFSFCCLGLGSRKQIMHRDASVQTDSVYREPRVENRTRVEYRTQLPSEVWTPYGKSYLSRDCQHVRGKGKRFVPGYCCQYNLRNKG